LIQTFTCFVFLDLASALQNHGINCALFQNQMLVTTVSVSFLVQLGFIYIPFQSVFQTEALAMHDLSVLLGLGLVSMGLHELRRRWERKANKEMDALYSGGMGDVV
jgi:Ca2+-transporting ATPase